MKLTEIRGIGPKTEELFARIGVYSTDDLIHYYPLCYDEFKSPSPIGALQEGNRAACEGIITGNVSQRRWNRTVIVSTDIADATGRLRLTWYNAPFIAGLLKKGSRLIFRGTVRMRKGVRVMEHPEIYTQEKYAALENTLVPVYGLTKGLTGKTVAKAVRAALDADNGSACEYLSSSMLHLLGFMDETAAIHTIHFPKNAAEFEKARRRLVFDEFFLFVLALRKLKEEEGETENAFPMKAVWESEELIDRLPYKLTGAQLRTWHEIEKDLAGKRLMNRLVQGDVGSGKTILTFLAAIQCAANGYQSALMAPTEVLARQHYEKLCALKEENGLDFLRPVLLTGSLSAPVRRQALADIEDGTANCVIGTHALIQTSVHYQKLALVMTDEQHRFGVRQRQTLTEKGAPPNSLVLSATPIPRTLGVIYYGDLDISVIDELPARRLPIKNAVVDESWREQAKHFIERQVQEHHQVYVICPMIEPSEELEAADVISKTEEMKKAFPDFRVAMLHGRMKQDEKNLVMEKFASGETDILVSTTVIEVGVDVPNATVMLIENAERFGLAQLHQLRGRVGRGDAQSYCIFMAGQKSETIAERLDILKESDDGFVIAEKDFELRGPGDLLGIRQSGDAVFRLADLTRDREILRLAGETAASLLTDDPKLIDDEHLALRKELQRYLHEGSTGIAL
ncbi:MAG: ATP-dependent DNA helicase RecG [Lachnospiraceae bacterium]|nr:ATP-dependent DNA helicase RecG [Lachnospiraceae bacterium]